MKNTTQSTAQYSAQHSTSAHTTPLALALQHPNPSARLRAVLAAGTEPRTADVPALLGALATEPDFYVRDMLTWALTRHSADATLPALLDMVRAEDSTNAARTQALHTLSKIASPRAWPVITPELLAAADDNLARTAWRTAAILAPEAARPWLVRHLIAQLGRGERDVQLSLSRVLADVADVAKPELERIAAQGVEDVTAAHAAATLRLIADPDAAFELDVHYAKRVDAMGAGKVDGAGE